jgi:PHD/YefM family antitoxin component YafN of YafNO toxin-antitoxin module
MKVSQFKSSLDDLHQLVAAGHGRIEITRDDCDHACILISKAELESLERALEILSETDDYQTMCQTVSTLASDCSGAQTAQTA